MNPREFDPRQLDRGRKHSLDLEFAAAGTALRLPVLLVRGERPGPVFAVSAGVHGDEYEGIQTIFEVVEALDPAAMSGDLLAVPVANEPAFWHGTRTSPLDDGNLARVFPGNPNGSPTEAIAWHFDQSILAHADLYLDLHSAGVRCLMPSLIGYDASDERSRIAAEAFGASVIWAHPTVAPGRTISAARARGIPALYTEARGAGRVHPADLRLYRRGVFNLLRHLGILAGEPETVPCQWRLHGDGNIDDSVLATRPGFLISDVELLQTVAEGQTMGRLLDLHGRTLDIFRAPRAGVVALIHACPKVEPGEPLFLVTGVAA